MNILFIGDEEEVRDRMAFALEARFNARVFERKTVHEAIDAVTLKKDEDRPEIDLIVFDYQKADAKEFGSFWNAAESFPAIACTAHKESIEDLKAVAKGLVGHISRENLVEELTGEIEQLLKRGVLKPRGEGSQTKGAGYCRVKTSLLVTLNPLLSDIYIQLSPTKYVKLFHGGDEFDDDDLEKWRDKKGVDYLYLKADETSDFIEKFRKDILKDLEKAESLPIEQAMNRSAAVHETIMELGDKMGFNEEVQELTKAQVTMTVKSMGQNRRLAQLLKDMKANEGKYISAHASLLAYVGCGIANCTPWAGDQTNYRITLAAYLHDYTLKDHDLAACTSLEEVDKMGDRFDKEQRKNFQYHMVKSAELCKQFKEIPKEVDDICLHHHELPDGSGFPRKMRAHQIPPLSSIFIFSHELVRFILRSGDDWSMSEFLDSVEDKFYNAQGGHFKKIMEAVRFE